MFQDRYGLPITTSSETAAAPYREGLDRILSAWIGAGAPLERAIAEDPSFALAYIARARVHQIYAEAADARAKAAHARSLAVNLTKRERQHIEIIASAIEGQSVAALKGAEQHLDEFPRDALVFSLLLGAFGLYAFSGRADHDAVRVAICERYAKHYGKRCSLVPVRARVGTDSAAHRADHARSEGRHRYVVRKNADVQD